MSAAVVVHQMQEENLLARRFMDVKMRFMMITEMQMQVRFFFFFFFALVDGGLKEEAETKKNVAASSRRLSASGGDQWQGPVHASSKQA